MAFDKLYLVNQMLLEIGEKKLGSLGTTTNTQRLVEGTIDGTIEEVFALPINYKFATARAELAQQAATPISGFDYMYKLPAGCVRILAMIDEYGDEVRYKWRREVYVSGSDQEDVLLTNLSTCFIKYIVLRTNPARWPGWFRRLVILTGAAKLCAAKTEFDYRKLSIKKDLEGAIIKAEQANNLEDANVDDSGRNLDHGNDEVVEGIMGRQDISEEYRGWS